MKLKQFIGDRAFYKMTLTVALPIMLQNFITNLVSMLDNLMVGALGTEQMSGVSIVNQLVFIFNLAVFGAMGGIGIFTAQFFGRGDHEGVRYTLRVKIYTALLITAAALGVLLAAQEPLISLFLHDAENTGSVDLTMAFAKEYLAVILLGLAPFAFSQAFAATLRETGDTFTPMITGVIAVAVNCLFNWLLIFGHLGFPRMGVRGAAVATVLSRYVELFIIVIYAVVKRQRFPYIKGLFRGFSVPGAMLGAIVRKALPLLCNEILWSAGMSTLSVAYSLHGLSVVAASSIASTVTNLFYIAFLSLGSSIGIISGNLLGAGKHEEAVDTVRKLIAFSLTVSVVMGTVLFMVGGEIPQLYKTSDESKALAAYFIRVCACFSPFVAFTNASYFTLRSGGKTLITSVFDSGTLWVFYVPVAFGLFYLFHLPIRTVFPIVQAIELLKVSVAFVLVKKKVWVKTII